MFAERAALETLIPELAESEDERIRKEMIQWFNEYKEGYPLTICDEVIDSWIAYLEKMKEQKPAEWNMKQKGSDVQRNLKKLTRCMNS